LLASLFLVTMPALVVSSTALAAPVGHASKTSLPPKNGKWKLDGSNYSQPGLRGSFTVTAKHRAVKKITITKGQGALANCGTGTLKVIGSQPILHVTGTTSSGPYNKWIVGKRTPNAGSPFEPKKIKLTIRGKRKSGTLELYFHGPKGGAKNTFGEISFGQCQYTFGFLKR
jgi:hypothetical protein